VPYAMRDIADGVRHAQLIDGDYFRLERLALQPAAHWQLNAAERARLLTVIRGALLLQPTNGAESLNIAHGTSVFVPACLSVALSAVSATTEILIATETR